MNEIAQGKPEAEQLNPEHLPGGEHRYQYLYRKHIGNEVPGNGLIRLNSTGQVLALEDSLDTPDGDIHGRNAMEALDAMDPTSEEYIKNREALVGYSLLRLETSNPEA